MAYTNIDDPSAHFHTQLYTGNGTAIGSGGNVITNNANSGNFKPDWTWHKVRSTANDHQVYDSSRGVKIRLNTNATNSDFTLNEGLQSFDTNGFTVGSDGGVNSNNQTYVAWQWKCDGGTTASNSNGSITSTVQANQDAGFSIVTYTGTGNTATVGHGLGVAPKIIIGKRRSQAANWWVGGSILTSAQTLYLNLTNAIDTVGEAGIFNVTTSTTFKLGTDTNRNAYNATNVAYCFAEKQGYSKFGSYVGNGNANGPFVYTGFKPAFVMIKVTTAVESWTMFDGARKPFNRDDNVASIYANTSGAEYTGASYHNIDILSNGFKVRLTNTAVNASGASYIYMAFAENPFVTSTGIPTTAR